MNNWSTERLTVTVNAQNTLQHFQGAGAPPLPMPEDAHTGNDGHRNLLNAITCEPLKALESKFIQNFLHLGGKPQTYTI